MTLLAALLLIILTLLPLAITLRGAPSLRGRRESAMSVHRAQLFELDRDRAEGQVDDTEYRLAVIEVQRRLLAAADTPEKSAEPSAPERSRPGRGLLVVAMVALPLAALGLYALEGHPDMPAAPLAQRLAGAERDRREASDLIGMLRQRLTGLDPKSELARQGYELLGNTEDGLGHLDAAAAAWRTALGIRFDRALAAELAEAQTRLDGTVSPNSADLFRRALAGAPADARWRSLAEQRLRDAQ